MGKIKYSIDLWAKVGNPHFLVGMVFLTAINNSHSRPLHLNLRLTCL